MSDWAQPFVEAGWAFDDRHQSVVSGGDWQASLGVVIDATGRWHVRLTTQDAAGESRRDYGFKKFHLVGADPQAYARFAATLIEGAAGLSKKSRKELTRQLAAQVNAAGATMVWFRGDKKIEL
ncbi:hypothetical protein [Mariniluteicoccus flavus]